MTTEAEAAASSTGGRIGGIVRDLPPAAFSLCMATGAVSTAAQLHGWDTISWGLFALNLGFFPVLLVLLAARIARFPGQVRNDFLSHARSPGFLAIVAAADILGAEFILRSYVPAVALALWVAAIALWALLIYGFFSVMTVLRSKPALDAGINASWMLLVVATQSISVLGTLLAPALGDAARFVLAVTVSTFLLGCMFYLLLFTLILYRYLFFPLDPAGLSPPYWINMGAVAITTLAGSLLILQGETAPFLSDLVPFLRGFTLLFWATATWWFPLVLGLGAWRHLLRGVPIRYDFEYWSMVFPLGMYAVATTRIGEALGWTFLSPIAGVVGYVAVGAWTLAFLGLIRRLPSAPR